MIHKNDKEFKEGMEQARKEVNYAANTDTVTTLFSTKKNFTKDNTVDDVIELSDKLYNFKISQKNLQLQFK